MLSQVRFNPFMCVCVCLCVMYECVQVHVCYSQGMEIRRQPECQSLPSIFPEAWSPVAHRSMHQALWAIASGDDPVSASHLAIGTLGWQTHGTTLSLHEF